MKITLDLPGELVRETELRAVHEGRKIEEVVTDFFRQGLARPESTPAQTVSHRVKLPLIECAPDAPALALTGEDIDRILMEDEIRWYHDAAGH